MTNLFNKVKSKLHTIDSLLHPVLEDTNCLKDCIIDQGISNALSFSFEALKQKVLSFVSQMKCEGDYEYKYSNSKEICCIYNSVYVCMLLSLFGELKKIDLKKKEEWVKYFDSFQDKETGFFIDNRIVNQYWNSINWWGAEHLCPHIINAYTALGGKPKYEFEWVKKYYDLAVLETLLNSCDWESPIPDENDIDNKIMNVGTILQYQRDFWHDNRAEKSVSFLKKYLRQKVNSKTGMWGSYDIENRGELARMIQFSYHLFRILFYDGEKIEYEDKIIDYVLKSQNKYAGWGAKLNSSACEDIDALNVLIYVSSQTKYRRKDVRRAIEYSLLFILANQNEDGGFVFRRDEPFCYGTDAMSSAKNVSAMFPTWFRTLSLAYINNYLGKNDFVFTKCPGY